MFRIKRDPAKLLGGAVARSTQPFGVFLEREVCASVSITGLIDLDKEPLMKTLAYRCPAAVIILFVWASLCAAQQMDRLVDWQPVVAPTSNNIPALEIVGIRVNETHVRMGEPFAADKDWLDNLTFRIRNTSDKTISAFWFNVAFPETDLPNGGYAGIGILFDAKKSSDQGKRISPGGEVDVPLAVATLMALRYQPRLPGTTQLTRLNFCSWAATFEDGSYVSGRSLRKP